MAAVWVVCSAVSAVGRAVCAADIRRGPCRKAGGRDGEDSVYVGLRVWGFVFPHFRAATYERVGRSTFRDQGNPLCGFGAQRVCLLAWVRPCWPGAAFFPGSQSELFLCDRTGCGAGQRYTVNKLGCFKQAVVPFVHSSTGYWKMSGLGMTRLVES